jgi:hypothetical protein
MRALLLCAFLAAGRAPPEQGRNTDCPDDRRCLKDGALMLCTAIQIGYPGY